MHDNCVKLDIQGWLAKGQRPGNICSIFPVNPGMEGQRPVNITGALPLQPYSSLHSTNIIGALPLLLAGSGCEASPKGPAGQYLCRNTKVNFIRPRSRRGRVPNLIHQCYKDIGPLGLLKQSNKHGDIPSDHLNGLSKVRFWAKKKRGSLPALQNFFNSKNNTYTH